MYCQFAQVSKQLSFENRGGFRANKHAVIKCDHCDKLLSAVAELPSWGTPLYGLSLHQEDLVLSARSCDINNNSEQLIVFGVKEPWEEPLTSGYKGQTAAAVHKLETKIGQSDDGNSHPKVTGIL